MSKCGFSWPSVINLDFKNSREKKKPVATCLRQFLCSSVPKIICNQFISPHTHNTSYCFWWLLFGERVGRKKWDSAYSATCLYSIVLVSVNQRVSAAKSVVKWEETNLPPLTAHSLTALLSVVNSPQQERHNKQFKLSKPSFFPSTNDLFWMCKFPIRVGSSVCFWVIKPPPGKPLIQWRWSFTFPSTCSSNSFYY